MSADEIEISPLDHPLDAAVTPPGSKSITNRILLIAAMAPGVSVIDGALASEDTGYMADALVRLGFQIERDEVRRRITVTGAGGTIPAHGADLYVGGAGTAMRFLAAFVTLGHGRFRLDGNQRMRERPAGPLLDALSALGARATGERGNRFPPLLIERDAARFTGGAVRIDASASSHFVSALLMPAPLWRDGLELQVAGETARPFIDMTLRLMRQRGVANTVADGAIRVAGGQSYQAGPFRVEPDASAASYFAAAAALCGGTVRIAGLGADSVQGDIAFLQLLGRMGARVRWTGQGVEVSGSGRLAGVDVAMNAMPDMVATLAVLAPFATTPTRIRRVAFIRHHESDRLRALADGLGRLGAAVHEFEDGLSIEPSALRPATIETCDDHRIAMAFSIAGLKLGGVRIKNPGCVAKTYPGFFTDLAALG